MKSAKRGKNILEVEVLNISTVGLWLLVGETEYFLNFGKYPWFKKARISEIQNVELLHGRHLHWPDLDVDLLVDSLKNTEKYPLISKGK